MIEVNHKAEFVFLSSTTLMEEKYFVASSESDAMSKNHSIFLVRKFS